MTDSTAQRRALARGGALSFVGSATSAALGFVLTVVFSRMLGTQGAGVVFQATGVFAVVMAFAKLGLDSTAIYLVPRVRLDDPRALRPLLRLMTLMSLAAGVLLVIVLEVLAPWVWKDDGARTLDSVRAVVLFVPVGALSVIASAVLRALGGVRQYVLVSNVALPVMRPPVVAVAAAATGSVVAVSAAWALPLVVVLAASAVLISAHLGALEDGAPARGLPDRALTRRVLAYTLPRTLSAGLEQALVWLDVLLVGLLAGDAAAGVYGGASRFIQAGLLVDAALRVVVSPQFSALLHTRQEDRLRDLHATATTWLVLVGTPVYVLLGCFAPVFLGLLGPEFSSGGWALTVLAAGVAITFLAGNIHSLLLMSGRSGWAAFNKAVVLVLNVVGNVVLLPRLGIVGAALTWTVCMTVDALLAVVEVDRLLGVRVRARDALVPLGVVLGTVGAPSLVTVLVMGRSATALAVACAVSAVAYLSACAALRGPLRLDGLAAAVRRRP
ncbi:oligosaccharide flippase family protein [Actinomyces howellii]|uniref:Stage V sporulation protein B n=1 Tax=Actinomyces howellii TaxID=52771 RepID=A0A3S4V5U7_9ACTO|nr:polysaccharide biosynthesis C-terminal domain-containing protein [Actinomyces howellii]VEG29543.1 stage V sporulation protein B [Actinomyces howellii]